MFLFWPFCWIVFIVIYFLTLCFIKESTNKIFELNEKWSIFFFTQTVYTNDDEQIPRNSSVVISRKPIFSTSSIKAKWVKLLITGDLEPSLALFWKNQALSFWLIQKEKSILNPLQFLLIYIFLLNRAATIIVSIIFTIFLSIRINTDLCRVFVNKKKCNLNVWCSTETEERRKTSRNFLIKVN